MRQIVLDTETTGLIVDDGHRIIEIACVELLDAKPTGLVMHQYLDPERDVEPAATAIHGIIREQLIGQPLFVDIADQLLDFIDGAQLVIHNAPFDLGFLNNELRQLFGGNMEPLSDAICTVALARRLLPGIRHSLNSLCDHYGIDRSHRTTHGALVDAQLLAQVYAAMCAGLEPQYLDIPAFLLRHPD